MFLEVCVDNFSSAQTAIEANAHRLELCSSLALGGLTPSTGLLLQIRKISNIPIHCLIRPRSGDFCYDENELQIMYKGMVVSKILARINYLELWSPFY